VASALLLVVSSSDPEKFCTLSDHAPWCGESHTTSPHHRDTEKASSLSALRISYRDIHGLLGLCDHPGQLC
jgi:hypothetical protein